MLAENITYQEMAKRIRVNKTSLYEWVSGKKTPRAASVKKIKYYIENLSSAATDFKKAHADVQKDEKPQAKAKKSCSGLKAYTRLKRWLLLYQS